MRTPRFLLIAVMVLAVPVFPLLARPAFGHDHRGRECSLATLEGLYVFSATGFFLPASGSPALPKAIVELIRFNGDGTVSVPGATVSINGVVTVVGPGGGGTYTVVELVPADDACVGTLNFSGPGPSFNLVVRRDGKKIWIIQTNPPPPATVMNIFEGTVTRLSP